MKNRIVGIRESVHRHILEKNPSYAAASMAHSAYCACIAALLSRLRGEDMELAQAAGWLHDVWLHERHPYSAEIVGAHAREGALLAEQFLRESGDFSEQETRVIVQAIKNHDDVERVDDAMSEILKDADMLSHYVNASASGQENAYHRRVRDALIELGWQGA